MTSFTFIHTADIHLDSPLKGLAGYDGPAVECIRTATRQAFDNLMSEAIDPGFITRSANTGWKSASPACTR